MNIQLNKDICIGCGTCESICPDVFKMGDDMKAHLEGADSEDTVERLSNSDSGCAEEAANSCAVQAITIEK